MLLQRFHLALASAAAAIVVLGFVAGASVWHVEQAAREVAVTNHVLPLWSSQNVWVVGGVTVATLLGLVGVSVHITRSFRRSMDGLWRAIDSVQAGRVEDEVSIEGDDELAWAARALQRSTRTLSQHTVSRSYLHDILDSMAEMLFVTGADGQIRRANRAAATRLDTTTDALKGLRLADLFDADPLAGDTGATVERTLKTLRDGTCPVLVSRSELRRTGADEPEVVCVAQDIRALKEAEHALRRSLREKDVLLREVHHRVKNNLQVVSSLLHAEQQAVTDDDARRRFEVSQQRIRSMAAIHEQLYRTDDLSRVDFAAYLNDLAGHLPQAHDGTRHTLRVEADPVRLPLSTAIPAGIIVNELVANAFEHAFPEGNPGTVTVQVEADDEAATLAVCDDGLGDAGWLATSSGSDAAPGASIGRRLVRGLARQLRGTLDVTTDGGTCVSITFPVRPASADVPTDAAPNARV